MRTARAVELGLCAGLLVGVGVGFVAGVGLVVQKPARFGLSENVSPPSGTHQSVPPTSSDAHDNTVPPAGPNGSSRATAPGNAKVGGDTSEDRVPHN